MWVGPVTVVSMSSSPVGLEIAVVAYAHRLVDDHDALVRAGRAAGHQVRIVDVTALGLGIGARAEPVVTVDGQQWVPDVVLPRGVNRPWLFVRQVLEAWQHDGAVVVPSIAGADWCADKLATLTVLARAGVAVLPAVGVVAGPRTFVPRLDGPVVTKPARGSKARGVAAHPDSEAARASLSRPAPLSDEQVDHQVVSALASGHGRDWRVVVADTGRGLRAIAVTERVAPAGEFVTNRAGGTVTDVPLGALSPLEAEIVSVAEQSADALDMMFAGVDVIVHDGVPVVLEVNAWPGLAVSARGLALAEACIEAALYAWERARGITDVDGSQVTLWNAVGGPGHPPRSTP